MKWSPTECEFGDMIRVRLGSIYHYGVFVSEDEVIAFGLPPIEKYKDDPGRLVVIATDIDVFSCGQIVERAIPGRGEKKKKISPEKAVETARSRLGETGYDLLRNNCEHFATECVFGERRCSEEEDARRRWLSRPVCDVYVANFSPEQIGEERIGAILCAARRREIEATSNAALRAARIRDWEVLSLAAGRSLKICAADAQFRKKIGGKWVCDKFEFSLTHTKNAVAAAVSNHPVGVDMEFVGEIAERFAPERLDGMRKRYFTAGEQLAFGGGAEDFARCFTAKEAAFKRSGKGAFRPSRIDTAKEPLVTFRLTDGAIVSVCTDHTGSVRVYTVDENGASLAQAKRLESE